ncbi:hypothetical protein [Lentiprolixibacter aurantiacus]|uniref:Lipoprotein n=1 Tax=Lentiprolixibacter aurantiacus TaxID=2993939 RepID=A0AAE3SMQ1_9FLAO|nr:hypothetical protein [Lentiprolixibacter aurantiacus]MCX2718814.1 hypothetical protein [Lentiprolixibacter aurantiacus]
MRFIYLFSALIILMSACRGVGDGQEFVGTSVVEIDVQELPQRSAVNPEATEMLKEWTAFQEMETSFDALYRVANNEDLILVVEDMILKQTELETSEYPEAFDTPQVKSRQKVFKTFLLKLKAAVEYRNDVIAPAKEMILAYNAFREQFNVTVNNTLDLNEILDEN